MGRERIQVAQLDVVPELEGEVFTLVAGQAGQFHLLTEDGEAVLSGGVSQPAAIRPAGSRSS